MDADRRGAGGDLSGGADIRYESESGEGIFGDADGGADFLGRGECNALFEPEPQSRRQHTAATLERGKPRLLFLPEHDPSAGEVVGGEFNFHLIPRQNADEMLAHLPRNMTKDLAGLTALFQAQLEHRIRQGCRYGRFYFNRLRFCHAWGSPVGVS